MLTSQYDIIVETLTGSEFEMTVSDKDTIGYIKSRIQKYEGIPIGQQHLLYNHKELTDTTEMKDIPLANGSRLKLVLDMRGGPISARRLVNLPDYDNWFDLNDVLNTSSRHDPLTISTPGVKLLVYKDYKKNVHRIMKLRSDRKAQHAAKASNESAMFTSDNNDQWVKDNLQTIEKMHQLRMQLEQKKKNKDNKKQKNNQADVDDNENQKESYQIDELCHNFKRQTMLFNESQLTVNKPAFKLTPMLDQQQQRKKSFEFPIPTLPRRSLSSGLLNKYGLNKTCIRPPSFVNQQQQQQQQQHQQQQRKSESNFFQLHALSPLSLPPPAGLSLSSSSLSKLGIGGDIKPQMMAPSISENNVKEGFNTFPTVAATTPTAITTTTAINRPKSTASITIGNGSDPDFDLKSKLRENIRRNRSFKIINTTIASEGDLMHCTRSPLINSPLNNRSLSSMIDQIFGTGSGSNTKRIFEKSNTSKSVQDLVEKIAITTITAAPDDGMSNSNDENNLSRTTTEVLNLNEDNEVGIGGGIRLPKLSNCLNASATAASTAAASSGFEFVDRHQHQHHNSLSLNSIDVPDGGGCIGADFKLEAAAAASTTSALDGGSSFRLYKMASADATNSYELPKLLIREDSPVESFHSSDPQLETLTIRGDTQKNHVDAFPKLTASEPATAIRDTAANATVAAATATTSKTIIKTPWNHHHSDLGLNNLELNFLNEEYSNLDSKLSVADNCSSIPNGSVLKIASNLEINSNCWNSNSSELDGQSQPSTTSLNFINGDLTSSDYDEEEEEGNLFTNNSGGRGSCCMLHSNSKSKSIELNDFRMMFGSSPTLLNSTNYNSVTHTSRLDAVPIQYRRGYSNLNDACLSSSTSDLELFNGVCDGGGGGGVDSIRKKNSSKSASQELPSAFSSRHHSVHHLLHHHHHHHHLHHHHHHHHHHKTANSNSLDFVRSYENLDRAKILRMKSEQQQKQQQQQQMQCYNNSNRNSILLGKSNLKHFWDGAETSSTTTDCFGGSNKRLQKNFSHEKLQEEDFYIDDDDFSYANLGYENALITTATNGGGGVNGGSSVNNLSNVSSGNRTNDCLLPLSTGFPSDESLFNMTLDRFTDEFNLLSTMSLAGIGNEMNCENSTGRSSSSSDRLLLSSATSPLVQQNGNDDDSYIEDDVGEFTAMDHQSSLLLSEFDIDGKSTIKKVPSSRRSDLQLTAMKKSVKKEGGGGGGGASVKLKESSLIQQSSAISKMTVQKPEKLRCAECNKKLGLIMIMKCHCEKVFCAQHRYAEAHNCSYNFKSEGKKILARDNPLVIAQKINKI